MSSMWAKKRVRVHLADAHPGVDLPSVEGLLLAKHGREFRIGRPELILDEGPAELGSRELVIPRERVAFYEVLN